MKKQIFLSIFLTALLVITAGTVLISGVLYGYYEGQYAEQLRDTARVIKSSIEAGGKDVPDAGKIRVTIIEPTGGVIYDSVADPATMENHSDRAEFTEALKSGEGSGSRLSETLLEKNIYYAVRLSDGNVLRVAKTQHSFGKMLLGALQPIMIVVFVSIGLALALSSGITKRLLKPINEIDLENVEDAVTYEEFTPFLRKIADQRNSIIAAAGEIELKRRELAAITDNMSEGMLAVGQDGRVISSNISARQMLGAGEAMNGETTLAWNRSEAFTGAVSAALGGKASEARLEIGDRSYLITASPVRQGSSSIGAVVLIVDTTLSEQSERLRREFTANVSHELKTPLTSISGYAEIIENGIAKQEDVQRFAGKIHSEAARMIELVSDIIKLSRLDEAGFPCQSERIRLNDLAEEAAAAVRSAAEKAGIEVSVSGGEAFIYSVRPLVYDIIYNLCDNAVKFGKRGGHVMVEVSAEGGHPQLAVTDDGIGIPHDQQARIFERFYRVDKSHSRLSGGTGLGLSIVKHAAAYISAEIELESQPSKGSTFKVKFK